MVDSKFSFLNIKNCYQSKYKAHTNGQILPYFVEITNYCDCTNPYNGFTKFVSTLSKDEESREKFKLKGKEEYESVKTYHYPLEYL